MSDPAKSQFVSRAGEKLAFALSHFSIDPTGWVCADLGSNVGGFVDCLLRRGAARVYAIDTSYGALDWSLRNDPRVVVMDRTNAMQVSLPQRVRLVTIDVGWTRQHLVAPRALDLLEPGGVIITLIKPHYESPRSALRGGVLPDEAVEPTAAAVIDRLQALGLQILSTVVSPLRGDAGNIEVLALIKSR